MASTEDTVDPLNNSGDKSGTSSGEEDLIESVNCEDTQEQSPEDTFEMTEDTLDVSSDDVPDSSTDNKNRQQKSTSSTDNKNRQQKSTDCDIKPSASKKRKLDSDAGSLTWGSSETDLTEDASTFRESEEPVTTRRRSTRSVRKYGQVSPNPQETEEGVDDPDYQQLSDSDDDPDFTPLGGDAVDVPLPEFNYRNRMKGRSRVKSKVKGRFSFTKITPKKVVMASNKTSSNDTTTTTVVSPDESSNGTNKSTTTATTTTTTTSSSNDSSALPSGGTPAKRRGRPLVYFNNSTTTTSSTTSTTSTTTTSTTDAEASSDTQQSQDVSSSTGDGTGAVPPRPMSPSKLSSAGNYPALSARQTQAVRLPEGPTLTKEQLKEIDDQFNCGDFVMAKKDMELDKPPIWRIDGKSLLQKFQAFNKDGKILYRNISTYSGWTLQGKTLYVPVEVNFIFQSRYDIVVEMLKDGVAPSSGAAGEHSRGEDAEAGGAALAGSHDKKDLVLTANADDSIMISDELSQHIATFEIYLQTLISQALDNNFLTEIYDENDSYFVDPVKTIDDVAESRKDKLFGITKWLPNFMTSLKLWPSVNIMSSLSTGGCEACGSGSGTAGKLALFYGAPYNATTLRPLEDADLEKDPATGLARLKNFNVCERCSRLCQMYNTLSHRKYDLYCKCKATVTNIRVAQPAKNTTTILRELLGNDVWITGLFRAMCISFVKVDRLCEEYHGLHSAASTAATDSSEALDRTGDSTPATDSTLRPVLKEEQDQEDEEDHKEVVVSTKIQESTEDN